MSKRDDPEGTALAATVMPRAAAGKKLRDVDFVSATEAEEAYALRLAGWSYGQIAKRVGRAESTVHKWCVDRLMRAAKHTATVTLPALRQQELERLDAMFATAYARGTGAPMVDPETGEIVVDDDGKPKRHEPDPRWLLRAETILSQRAALLGVDQPTRVKIEGEIKHTHAHVHLDALTPVQLATLEFLLTKAGLAAAPAGALTAPGQVLDAEFSAGATADPAGAPEPAEEG